MTAGNPSLSRSAVGKGGFPRSLQRDSWAPDNYSDHTLKTACWIIQKSPNLRGLGEVLPDLRDLLKAWLASGSPSISAWSLWSKALQGPYGTQQLANQPLSELLLPWENRTRMKLCSVDIYSLSITQNLLQSGSKFIPLPGRDTQC